MRGYIILLKQIHAAIKQVIKYLIELIWVIIAYPFYKNKKDIPWVFKDG